MACSSTGSVGTSPTDLCGVINVFVSIINKLIPFIIALTLLVFIWGIFQFVLASDSEEKRSEGRSTMLYGIIALFVMVSVWGLVNILVGTFGLSSGGFPALK